MNKLKLSETLEGDYVITAENENCLVAEIMEATTDLPETAERAKRMVSCYNAFIDIDNAANKAAKDYAKSVLGNKQFNQNKDAVESISSDFLDGVKWVKKQAGLLLIIVQTLLPNN